MRFFHATIHARPAEQIESESITVESVLLRVLRIVPSDLSVPFDITFDNVASELTSLPRCYFEPDGSFVWVSENGPTDWQLDGLLNDRGDRLMTVDLKGSAPQGVLRSFLKLLSRDESKLVFQDMQRGMFYDERCFFELFSP